MFERNKYVFKKIQGTKASRRNLVKCFQVLCCGLKCVLNISDVIKINVKMGMVKHKPPRGGLPYKDDGAARQ